MFKFEACEVLKAKELTFVNGWFQNERNEEIGHCRQTLIRITLNDLNDCKYEITATTGTIVKTGKIKNNNIDLFDLNSGIYFIKIFEIKSDTIKVAKIIKE